MGGRGSMGGTRSTYRKNSTEEFKARSLFPSNNNNASDGSGGGGGSSKNKNGGNSGAGTGGIEGGGGSGGVGGGGSTVEAKPTETDQTTETDSSPATDTNDQQPILTEEELYAMFAKSDQYKAFFKKNYKSDAAYDKAETAAYTDWIQSTIAQPQPPEGPLGGFRRVSKIAATKEELAVDAITVNPHYFDMNYNLSVSADATERNIRKNLINCQRCVVAGEVRSKGYDVMAEDAETGYLGVTWNESRKKHNLDGALPDQIAELFEKEDGTNPEWEYVPKGYAGTMAAAMEAKILSWGEGARGFVGVEWNVKSGDSAHIFSVQVINGEAFYIDYQSSESGDSLATGLDGWKANLARNNPWQGVLRVDNTELSAEGVTWVRERTDIQINAPSFDELESHIEGKTDDQKILWRHVWQKSVTGETLTVPQDIADDPVKLAEVKRAAYWVRRPD